MNYVDAEIIAATLAQNGGKLVEEFTSAGLIIVVTCGVRAGAEERVVSWTKKLKRQNEKAVIVLTGCLSHRLDIEKRLGETVDFFIPIENWTTRLEEVLGKMQPCDQKSPKAEFYQVKPQYKSSFQAYIPIMTGCNNFCSYCVVPYARGREKSQNPEDILKEIGGLIKKGYKEIYLLGQNINSYQGKDHKGEIWNFSRLLRSINDIPGKFWIRFISSHPKDITEEMIKTLADCQKVSPNLHLPIQSGSTRVLKLMNRHYSQADYLRKIEQIRKIYPQVVLSTDIIVGFPGETEKDFQESLKVVKKVSFEMLFSLKYSPRPQTTAFKMKDSVLAQKKIERQQKLDQVWKKIALKKNQRFLGQNLVILVDRIKTKNEKIFAQGKSFDNKDILAEITSQKPRKLLGSWAEVKIEEATPLALKGKLVHIKKEL